MSDWQARAEKAEAELAVLVKEYTDLAEELTELRQSLRSYEGWLAG